jgi:hypothetical protein
MWSVSVSDSEPFQMDADLTQFQAIICFERMQPLRTTQ